MHLLHALFTPTSGGLEQSYVDATEAIVSKAHTVTALLRGDAPYREAVSRYAKTLYDIRPTGFYDYISAWRVRKIIRSLSPDLIVAHNARAIALLVSAARGTGIPVCGVSHSYKTARTVRADALIVLTEHMRQHFLDAGYPPERLSVIPNLIHLPEKYVARKRGEPLVIGALGRFTVEKGFDDLLRALHELKQSGVEFSVRIAGEGEEMHNLRTLAGKLGLTPHIRWEGWIQDKAAFYCGLDIVCVPSLEESFGLVVLEAFAHGVPVVATDAPGPASIIRHGIDGLLMPRGDAKALAQALRQLATHPGMAASMAEAGWKSVQQFGFDAVADKWDNALRSIASTAMPRQAA